MGYPQCERSRGSPGHLGRRTFPPKPVDEGERASDRRFDKVHRSMVFADLHCPTRIGGDRLYATEPSTWLEC
eukprot:1364730-Amorphochlora_amoeboformis.AAC.1